MMPRLSVVIPVYNEKTTLLELVKRVESVAIDKEILLVDDCSTDGTRDLLASLEGTPRVRVFYQDRNQGKGAALRRGFAEAHGELVIVQDADLEYDPAEYPKLIEPILDGRADVVYGSRFVGSQAHRVLYFWHSIGNRGLTMISNMFTNLNLTDMETCYKVFRREIADRLDLKSRGFAVEPEITAKVAKLRARVYEVPIRYAGRDYAEGKKIGPKDGVIAIYAIVRWGLFARV